MTKYAEINLPAIFTEQFDKLRRFDRDLITTLNEWQLMLKAILDGGISFTDNVDIDMVTVTSNGTPGNETSVTHRLGKVPAGYIVTGQNAAGSLYDGTTANTATAAYFKSDVAIVQFRIILF